MLHQLSPVSLARKSRGVLTFPLCVFNPQWNLYSVATRDRFHCIEPVSFYLWNSDLSDESERTSRTELTRLYRSGKNDGRKLRFYRVNIYQNESQPRQLYYIRCKYNGVDYELQAREEYHEKHRGQLIFVGPLRCTDIKLGYETFTCDTGSSISYRNCDNLSVLSVFSA